MAPEEKNPPANAGDIRDGGSVHGSGRCPGGEHGSPLQYSCLENPRTGEPGGLQSIGSQGWTQLKQLNAYARRGLNRAETLRCCPLAKAQVLPGAWLVLGGLGLREGCTPWSPFPGPTSAGVSWTCMPASGSSLWTCLSASALGRGAGGCTSVLNCNPDPLFPSFLSQEKLCSFQVYVVPWMNTINLVKFSCQD